jgi:hypothetical protein
VQPGKSLGLTRKAEPGPWVWRPEVGQAFEPDYDRIGIGTDGVRLESLTYFGPRTGPVGEARGRARGGGPSGARGPAPNEERGGGFVHRFLVDRQTCGRAEGGVGRPAPNKTDALSWILSG